MTHLLKDHFEGALSELKMKNIDTASLHEIIGEFAPLIGMNSDETNALKSKHVGAESAKEERKKEAVTAKKENIIEPVCPTNGYSKMMQQAEAFTAQTALDLSMKSDKATPSSLDIKNNENFIKIVSCKTDALGGMRYINAKQESETPVSVAGVAVAVVDQSTQDKFNVELAIKNAVASLPEIPVIQEKEDSNLDASPDTSNDLELSEKSFKSLYEMKTVCDLRYYQCKVCPKVYDTKYHLFRHLVQHAGNRPFKCSKCSKAFSQKCDLNRHMNVHNDLRKHVCSVCNKSFKRADYLSKHEKQYCGVMKPFKCSKCSKGFEDQKELNEHARTHNDSTFHCEHCSEEFENVDDLVKHRKTHSKQNEEYNCTRCGQHFTDFSSYVDHFKSHSGERPYACDLCQKQFSRNHNLMTHMWIHNTEKQHTCHICAKTFTYYSNLQVHLRVHRNERPYKCNECDKGFLTSSDLRRHKRTHSGEKPYKCSKCAAMYARKERLISHMVMHMEEGADERGLEASHDGSSLQSLEASHDGSPLVNGGTPGSDVAEEINGNISDGVITVKEEVEMETEEYGPQVYIDKAE